MASFFALEEMRCKSGSVYPAEYVQVGKWLRLQQSLDAIRGAWGSPIAILCGYRTAEYNAQLREESIQRLMTHGRTRTQAEAESGVAIESKHIVGEAADIRPAEKARSPQLTALILEMVKAGRLPLIGGVGSYPTWTHVDVRPRPSAGKIATWGHV